MAPYKPYSITLTDGQKRTLANANKNRLPLTLRLKNSQLSGDFSLLLTQTQINRIKKASAVERGVDIKISKTQKSAQSKYGGFLGALAGLVRGLIPLISKVAAPLATGALLGLASIGIGNFLDQR